MKILVAGLSGQLGNGLLEGLDPQIRLVPVVRDGPASARRLASARALGPDAADDPVIGDVTQPLWGLTPRDLDRLAPEIDVVLNLAGETNWAARRPDLERVNHHGALHGAGLADEMRLRGGQCRMYCYVSSIHVAAGRSGVIPEQLLPPDGMRTPYEHAKWLAELDLMSRDGDVPVLVARLGGLVGNSRTGRTVRRNSLYVLADRASRFPFGFLPASPTGRVDMLPRDLAGSLLAQAILAAVQHPRSRIVHVCAGDDAPTLAAFLTVARSVADGRAEIPARLLPLPAAVVGRLVAAAPRFGAVGSAWVNELVGLRYVSVDRVMERLELVRLIGDRPPRFPVEQLARLVLGLPEPSFDHRDRPEWAYLSDQGVV